MSLDHPLDRRTITVESDSPAAGAEAETPAASAATSAVPRRRALPASLVVTTALWVMFVAYAGFFVWLEWLRYDHFLMHAQDLGNMEQAVWNTVHGLPFHFNNLRIAGNIEASGTSTRLSFHVEPILLLVAIPYFFHASPLNLFIIQELVVASGVFPVALLARRHLHSTLAQIVFPLAYLLMPALEAATVYEFHAVTMSAALLLWALYFADGRRYWLFAVFGALAAFTKEEMGFVVAMMGLWIWWRHRDRNVGLMAAILGIGWSLFCVLVVIRHFGHGHGSPYCARFNPYQLEGQNTGPGSMVKTCAGVARIWIQHPDQVWDALTTPAKLGYLHRLFIPTGYLSLLSPLTLLISLPSLAVIMFSTEPHMYSGLAHYTAEIVPLIIASAIFGVAWLARTLERRLRIPARAVVIAACAWLLVASVANGRVNGFTPLYEGFSPPQTTYHDQVGQRMLAEIPPNAPVSAGDYENPHLSDRAGIYLFPDVNDAQYALVDVSRDAAYISAYDTMGRIHCMLHFDASCNPNVVPYSGGWGVKDAADGYILMERREKPKWGAAAGLPYDPSLPTTLPPSFYSFAVPATPPHIAHPMTVDFGPSLRLLGYDVQRRERVNLRQPDVLLTTYWELTSPITQPITPVVYMTNGDGAIDVVDSDLPAIDWLPTTQWPLHRVITVQTLPETVATNTDGAIDIDLGVYKAGACGPLNGQTQADCNLISNPDFAFRPNVRDTPGHVPLESVASGTILKLTHVQARW